MHAAYGMHVYVVHGYMHAYIELTVHMHACIGAHACVYTSTCRCIQIRRAHLRQLQQPMPHDERNAVSSAVQHIRAMNETWFRQLQQPVTREERTMVLERPACKHRL